MHSESSRRIDRDDRLRTSFSSSQDPSTDRPDADEVAASMADAIQDILRSERSRRRG